MNAQRIAVLALGLVFSACQPSASVVGRWQRIGQPSEWIEFHENGRFTGRSFTDTHVRGTYEQRGTRVIGVSEVGYRRTLELKDSLLVMQDGTRFRRSQNAGE